MQLIFTFFDMEKIITQLQEIVNQPGRGSWCQRDFTNYDVPNLKRESGPFFWMVRENGTALVQLAQWFNSQTYNQPCFRMPLFRQPLYPLWPFEAHENSADFYYYDGMVLREVEYQEIQKIFTEKFTPLYNSLKAQYHEEYRQCRLPLDIEYVSEETYKNMAKCLEYAYSIGDTTLISCIERLSHYARFSLNHKIVIYNDFATNSFGFQEILDGVPRISGGIIFHQTGNKSYWSIHT